MTVRAATPSDPVLRVQSHLTGRDVILLGWLADHGVLTSAQIAQALFPSLDFAQRRLRTLCTLGLTARFRPLKPDGGSNPYHYVLAQLGACMVAAQRGQPEPRPGQARERMRALTSRANLAHLLGVNQFFTDLAGHARTHPGARLDRWWPTAACTRIGAFADPCGNPYTPAIHPDGHAIYTEAGRTVAVFVEHDTGSEPLHVLIDKLPRYAALARVTGRDWPVLFWLHSAARERHLHDRLAAARASVAVVPVVPVATATRDHAAAEGLSPAEAIWWLHAHPGPLLRLTDLPGGWPAGTRSITP